MRSEGPGKAAGLRRAWGRKAVRPAGSRRPGSRRAACSRFPEPAGPGTEAPTLRGKLWGAAFSRRVVLAPAVRWLCSVENLRRTGLP